MSRGDGNRSPTATQADTMATPHLSSSDENQNQVSMTTTTTTMAVEEAEQCKHTWEASCRDQPGSCHSNHSETHGVCTHCSSPSCSSSPSCPSPSSSCSSPSCPSSHSCSSPSSFPSPSGSSPSTCSSPSSSCSSPSFHSSHTCSSPSSFPSPSSSPAHQSGPSADLLASLQQLGEHRDHTLLPQSLHQIAEAYFREEDYRWAVHFLQLEKLYHERLLSNLATLQQQWECQWKVVGNTPGADAATLLVDVPQEESERMNLLSRICTTHQRPLCTDKGSVCQSLLDSRGRHRTRQGESQIPQMETTDPHQAKDERDGLMAVEKEEEEVEVGLEAADQETLWEDEEVEKVDDEEDDGAEEEEEEEDEEGQMEEHVEELQSVTREASEQGLEPVREPVKIIEVEELCPANGLVSILKRRAGQVEGTTATTASSGSTRKRKVRFSEPYEDDGSTDSCMMLVVLCLVTVVISLGGTALYCFLGNTNTAVCVDFSNNMEAYWVPMRKGFWWLANWFIPKT